MTDQQILEQDLGAELSDQTKSVLIRKVKGLGSFQPLANCPRLRRAVFRTGSKIPPLDPLVDCPLLRSLAFQGTTRVENFAPLERMSQLERLEVGGKLFEQLDGLKLPVDELWVRCARIDQLGYFRNCAALKQLELGADTGTYTAIGDTADFAPVRGIERLFLMSRVLTKTDCLASLTNCRSLFIGANKRLDDLGGLSGLEHLEALAVDRSSVRDLTPLNGLPLRYLSAGKTKVNQVDDLSLPKLTQLYLSSTRIKSFSGNDSFSELELLSLSGTPIRSLSGVASLPSLKYLSLVDCEKLTDFGPLSTLVSLEAMDLTRTAIDVDGLKALLQLPRLQQVAIGETSISADDRQLAAAQQEAAERNVQLAVTTSELFRLQYAYYRQMNHYLHAYQGADNPWHDD